MPTDPCRESLQFRCAGRDGQHVAMRQTHHNLRTRATPSTRRTGEHHRIWLPMLDDVHRCQHRWLGADEVHLMFGINSIHPDDDGVAQALHNKQLRWQ